MRHTCVSFLLLIQLFITTIIISIIITITICNALKIFNFSWLLTIDLINRGLRKSDITAVFSIGKYQANMMKYLLVYW